MDNYIDVIQSAVRKKTKNIEQEEVYPNLHRSKYSTFTIT